MCLLFRMIFKSFYQPSLLVLTECFWYFFIIFPLQGCCIQIVTQSQMSQPSTLLCPQRRTLTGYAKYVNSGTTWHTADQCMTRLWDVHRVHRCLSLVDCVNKNKYLAKAELGGRPIHSKFWTGWIYTEWTYSIYFRRLLLKLLCSWPQFSWLIIMRNKVVTVIV